MTKKIPDPIYSFRFKPKFEARLRLLGIKRKYIDLVITYTYRSHIYRHGYDPIKITEHILDMFDDLNQSCDDFRDFIESGIDWYDLYKHRKSEYILWENIATKSKPTLKNKIMFPIYIFEIYIKRMIQSKKQNYEQI